MASTNRSSGGNFWAEGIMLFAAAFMTAGGIFQALQGLAAIINDEFFVISDGYAYHFDVTVWGWLHLAMGIVLVITGIALLQYATWARFVAIFIVICAAVINFLYIPYQPLWSIVLLAIDGAVLWALVNAPARSSRDY